LVVIPVRLRTLGVMQLLGAVEVELGARVLVARRALLGLKEKAVQGEAVALVGQRLVAMEAPKLGAMEAAVAGQERGVWPGPVVKVQVREGVADRQVAT